MSRASAKAQEGAACVAHLSLHVHDDHRVGAVTDHEVLRVLGQQEDVIDGDVGAGRRAQRFEGAAALSGLHVPQLVGGEESRETERPKQPAGTAAVFSPSPCRQTRR